MSASTSTVDYDTKELVDCMDEVEHQRSERSPSRPEEVRYDVNLSRWRDERSCFARAPEPEFFTASTPLHRYSGGYSSGARFMSESIGYVQDRGGLYHASEGRF
ncbi:hypothetical protein QR680_019281 [Steinernema hermaphroditum]|uniref:Uncharacterized protein n=1 Tax=Steinernema hermaphroditum TaxID=289476 RepID=A0AA39GN43_9BILA|nr:hypothetical protein QR680_019281 [Steinernema hermaphroditum]